MEKWVVVQFAFPQAGNPFWAVGNCGHAKAQSSDRKAGQECPGARSL